MKRQLLVSLVIGLGLALTGALAQDNGSKPVNPDRAAHGDEDTDGVDKAISDYQNRLRRDIDQSRKAIDELRKELKDLIDLRYDAALSTAKLRADLATTMGPVATPAPLGTPVAPGGTFVAAPAAPAPAAGGREQQRLAVLNQELRQLESLLRTDVQGARNQTDQMIGQLHMLRDQRRQQRAQIRAEEERAKSSADAPREKHRDEPARKK